MQAVNASPDPAAVCAVVVNWNGWSDTLVCLQSLFSLHDAPLRVVICDNASTDASLAELERYLCERFAHWRPADGEPGFEDAQAGRGLQSVHLVRLPGNLGYAGALNAGMAWARSRWTPQGYWLLNNDVQAQPGALAALVAAQRAVPDAGICGSVLLDWDEPGRVQGVAGIFCRWLGVGWHDREVPAGDVSFAVDYPIGASMYVAAAYIDEVGPLDASYFLYFEEMDWAERGRRHGYRPLVALRSRLRHKEGASTGSRGGVRNKSMLSERYGAVNRLRITRKFWPHYLPLVWASLGLVVIDRLVHGELARAGLVARLMFAPWRWLGREGAVS